MPVLSYLAYPLAGAREQLIKDLETIKYCEILPADNSDIMILITDTPNQEEEQSLQEKLRGLASLQSLSMTFGHVDQ